MLLWERAEDSRCRWFEMQTTLTQFMIEPLETRIAPAGAPVISLSDFASPQGFRLTGAAPGDSAGSTLNVAGDVNGDGFADFIIGAPEADPHGPLSGASYVIFGRAGLVPGALELSALNGTNGFRISGAVAGDHAGVSVSGAGDVNGDGLADLVVGADRASPHGTQSGAAYVIFGKASGFSANLDLAKLNGRNGFKLNGEAVGDNAGGAVSGAGDVNGDGFADVLIGASNNERSGAAYVVYGKAAGFAAKLDLARLNGRNGFKLRGGALADSAGAVVSGAGDVNGDGFADLLTGAAGADLNGSESGAAYLVFGKASGLAPRIDLATLDGTTGFRISGEAAGNKLGNAVHAAGDVNGDGRADLLVGAVGAGSSGATTGAAYVIFGRAGNFPADLPVATLGGNAGFKLNGETPGDGAGVSVRGAGDVNGDGLADFLIGADGADPNGSASGAAYVVFGRIGGFAAEVALSLLDGTDGFQLNGAAADDRAGQAVSPAGDVNGDGFADILVGAPFSDPNNTARGASYLVFGQAGGFGATLELAGLDGFSDHTGFRLSGGAAGDFSGRSVTGVGDVNGDGFADVVIGAFGAGGNTGAAYVVFGQATGLPADLKLATLDGTNGFRLSGEAAGDYAGRSVGAAGDLNGDGFADLLIGAYTAAANGTQSGAAYVVFGKGTTFAANLNLSALDGANGFKIPGLATGDLLGRSVGTAGDVNGDGLDDVIVGARGVAAGRGAAYVIFGRTTGFGASFDLATLNGATGFRVTGEAAGDLAGFAASGAGDVNGDGLADVVVGAFAATNESGAAYVVFGQASGLAADLDLATLNGANGFKLAGLGLGKRLGRSVSGLGDVNADGLADFIIGAPDVSTVGNSGGAAYVIFGQPAGFAAALDVTTLAAGRGLKFSGVAANDELGGAVSGPGDVNGDGFADIAIGATNVDGKAGATYLIFGRPSGFATDLKLSSLDGTNGFKLSGESLNDELGRSVSPAGDLNGDGLADLLVGASGAAGNTGASYVVFGAKSATAVFVSAGGRFVVRDADGDPVTVAVARGGFARVTLAVNGDIGTLEILHSNLASKLAISVPKNKGTTIGHILVTNGPGAAPEHFGAVKLGPGVILGDGTLSTGAALEITGKTKSLVLSDVGANARITLGRQLPYDAPDRRTPDTLNNHPNLSIRNVLGPGVEINVLGDGQPAGTGGGGLGKVVVKSWGRDASGALAAFPGSVRTTQSIGSFRLLQGDFGGGIEIDQEHVGSVTAAGIQLVSIRGAWGGTLTAEGVVGSFSAADFPGSIVAGAMKTLNLRGTFSGRVTLSSQTLGAGDFRDAGAFLGELAASTDAVSAFLWNELSATTKTTVLAAQAAPGDAPKQASALTALLPELNRLLNGFSIHNVTRFASVVLSDETSDLLASDPRGAELIRLNRLLLGDAYRDPGALHLGLLQEPLPLAAAQDFVAGDFPDPAALAAKLVAHADPVSAFLWSSLSAGQQRVLGSPTATVKQLQTTLLAAFNRLLDGPSIYDAGRFAGVALSAETAALTGLVTPDPAEVVRLNRLLLSDTFRDAARPFLGAFQEAPDPVGPALDKVKVTGEFTGALISESAIKNMALTSAFLGTVAADAVATITAFRFDGTLPLGQKSITVTDGTLGMIKATNGTIANYRIDADGQTFGGFSVNRTKLIVPTIGIHDVTVVATQIGNISVSLKADPSTPTVALTGIKDSAFVSTVAGVGKITSSHAVVDSSFLARTNLGGLQITAGNLDGATFLAGVNVGADHALGGAGADADTFFSATIGAIKVTGKASGSAIGAGYQLSPAGIVGGLASKIASLIITGTASGNTFAAGKFTTLPKVNGLPVVLGADPQFPILPAI